MGNLFPGSSFDRYVSEIFQRIFRDADPSNLAMKPTNLGKFFKLLLIGDIVNPLLMHGEQVG
jgi:hypothetical protein